MTAPAPIMCTGGAGGPAGHAEAFYSVTHHELCFPTWHACWQCIGSMLTAAVTAWYDDGGYTICAYCLKPVPHLEDWFMLVQIRPGITIGEAWKKFTEENEKP